MILVQLTPEVWVDPRQIEAVIDNLSSTLVMLRSGERFEVYGLKPEAILDTITDALDGQVETIPGPVTWGES